MSIILTHNTCVLYGFITATTTGKSAKDLFSKKFDYENSLKVKSSNPGGVSLESTAVSNDSGLRGVTKATIVPQAKWGKIEAEIHTDNSQINKLSANYNKLAPGLNVAATLATRDKDSSFKKPVVTEELEYTADYISVKGTLKTDTDTHKADVCITTID